MTSLPKSQLLPTLPLTNRKLKDGGVVLHLPFQPQLTNIVFPVIMRHQEDGVGTSAMVNVNVRRIGVELVATNRKILHKLLMVLILGKMSPTRCIRLIRMMWINI